MNKDENNSHGDVVEDAVRQLTSTPVDDNRLMVGVEKTRAALAEAIESGHIAGALEHPTWRRKMTSQWKKYVALAAVIAIGFSAWAWLWPANGSSGVAFGHVLQQIRAVRAVTFKMTVPVDHQVGEFAKPVFEVMELPSGHTRWTYPGGAVMVVDPESSQFLMLDPAAKSATLTTVAGHSDLSKNRFSLLREIREETGEFRGTEKLDGRAVSVFEAEADGRRCVVWADNETGLPARAEMHWKNVTEADRPIVLSDFEYDVELDDSLFSLTPPEGYTLKGRHVDTSDRPAPTEQDLIGILAVWADLNDGAFPEAFGQIAFANAMLKVRSELGTEPARQKLREIFAAHFPDAKEDAELRMHQTTSGFRFAEMREQWRYMGESVKLGDAGAPVCWWKGPEADTYRAVYGDLTVRDVPAEELPEIP